MDKANKTKQKILIAAKHVFAQNGYWDATIKAIATEADVARGLLHYHFKSKEDLYIQVFRFLYGESLGPSAMDQTGAGSASELAAILTFVFRESLRHAPEVYQLIYDSFSVMRQCKAVSLAMQDIWGEYRHETVQAIERLIEQNVIQPSCSSEVLVTLFVAILHGVGLQVIGEPGLNLLDDNALWEDIEKQLKQLFGP